MKCDINGTKYDFSSVYLSAQPSSRKEQLRTINKDKILKEHAITGGDFNCVENCDLDIKYPARGGATYANAGGKTLARTMADCGMIDTRTIRAVEKCVCVGV
eukprot:scaffold3594_cov133-Isochrysis_galbana.AAC.4